MRKTIMQEISTFSMKVRIYPSAEQKDKIDAILRALHIAYNITFHHVFLKDPMVCSEPNADGAVWPDYRKMCKKEWRAYLISQNPAVEIAPAISLMGNYGIFNSDAKRA